MKKSDFAMQYDLKSREESLKMIDASLEPVTAEIKRIRELPGRQLKASDTTWLMRAGVMLLALSTDIKTPKG